MDRPPHPGPQPPLFRYPFAEASAARTAADALADTLGRLRDTHDDAWSDVEAARFEGRTAGELRARLRDLLAGVDDAVDALRRQADDLADEITLAEQRQLDNAAARAAWSSSYRAWADWRPPAPVN